MTYQAQHKRQHRRFHRNPKALKVYVDALGLTFALGIGYLLARFIQEEVNHADLKFVLLWSFPCWFANIILVAVYRTFREVRAQG